MLKPDLLTRPTQVKRASSGTHNCLPSPWSRSGGGSRAGGREDESDGAQADDSVDRGKCLAGVIDSLRTALVNVYD
jgi:hypothetical protein